MTGHPARRLHIYSAFCRDKQRTPYSVPAGVTYKDITGALRDRFRDDQPVVAYWSQLKTKDQLRGETLQEFTAAIKQLVHQAFINEVWNWEVK
jgi:hypothetical protein